ncbi:hypothetical protein ABXJ76_07780 [Methylobacter sp. G7]|uniref:hypothetical protein n=1 Tax=Methylobacter sp. G7 TaxID=3230117 RepID=UPI003D805802
MIWHFSGGDYAPLTSFSLFGVTTEPVGDRTPVVYAPAAFSMAGVTTEPVGDRTPVAPASYVFGFGVDYTPVSHYPFSGDVYAPGNLYDFADYYTPENTFALFEVPPFVRRVPVLYAPALFTMAGVTTEPVGDRTPVAPAVYIYTFAEAAYTPGGGFSFVAEIVDEGSGVVGHLSAVTDDAAGSFVAYVAPCAVLSAVTDDAVGSFSGKIVTNQGVFSATTDDAVGSFSGEYDSNVPRYTVGSVVSDQQEALQAALTVNFVYEQTIPAPLYTASIQQQAAPLNHAADVVMEQTLLLMPEVTAVAEQAIPLTDQFAVVLEQMELLRPDVSAVVEQAIPLSDGFVAGFNILDFTHSETTHPVQDCKDSLHTVLRRYWHEVEPVSSWVPSHAFTFASQADINDDRSYSQNALPAYNFTADYAPSSSFVPVANSLTATVRNPVAQQQVTPTWQGAMVLRDFAIYHAGMLLSETESRFQRAARLGVEFRSVVQDAQRVWTGGNASPWVPTQVYPPNPDPTDPPGHVTITIPTQSAYIMQHTITVTLLDLTPISMESVNLGLDADSFAWQFSGTLLDKSDLVKVQQVGSDEPVQLVITINGYNWKVLVERIEHSRQFGGRSISLSGRGLTALLGQPYEQPASATQSSALTVQQLAELQLPTGWTINWTAVTWLVPSGAYSYNNQTPIQALATLVGDIGAMIVPSRDSKVLNVMPRYPVLPWDFGLLSPDVVIPEAAITELSQRPVVPYQANGVYVHGTEVGGVLAWCRLDGTDGARLASTTSNALMTDAIGCRALGERIIAGQYTQPSVRSLSVPMDGVIVPLVSVGQLVSVTLDGVSVKGIVNSVSIAASLGSVRQTIQIGEETPNTWAMFKELLPRDPLLVGTLSVTDSVISLITLLDGGVVRVRGTGTVGGKYYIRAGKIDGEAPAMGQNEIVI